MIGKAVLELNLKIGKVSVFAAPHLHESVIQKVSECKKFNDYVEKLKKIDNSVQVSKIEIVGVEMFGERVGFVNLRVSAAREGYSLPGYVFLRGPAVAILLFVNGKLLLVQQFRVPIAELILEAPAGMLDESGDFVGTAAVEIQEQTSLKISKDKLISLGSYYPSVGGSDEEVLMYYSKIDIPQQKMKQIESKVHGIENQRIRVKLIEYDPKTILATKDSKLICMMYAYEAQLKDNKSEME